MSWFAVFRLGLIQACLGGIVVLATSTLNRVMTVELALPAVVPGALIALHYAVQALRPLLGHGSDRGGRRTPWIVGGVALLGTGLVAAAFAIGVFPADHAAAIAIAIVAYATIGVGVGAAGTGVLVLLADRAAPARRAAAASIVWIMMIFGIALTATLAGRALDPFTAQRLLMVSAVVAAGSLLITVAAISGLERGAAGVRANVSGGFRAELTRIWAEPSARRFALFVFTAMLAYSAQELILEPFSGVVAGLTPGASAGLTGLQHAGVLAGMLSAALLANRTGGARVWTVGGCAGSAAMLLCLAAIPALGQYGALRPAVFGLGVANGAFAVSAIGAMMGLAAQARDGRAGIRMGLFGAAQAWAFGAGGLLGTGATDLFRALIGSPAHAYAAVFAIEAAVFALAAWQATAIFPAATKHFVPQGEPA